MAKKNLAALTLRAHGAGYVALKQNTQTNFYHGRDVVAGFPAGRDAVRAGMAIAEIPICTTGPSRPPSANWIAATWRSARRWT